MVGVHLRSESEMNIEGIFKERVHLRGLYDFRESLNTNLSENSQERVHLRAESDENVMEFSKSVST